MAWEAAGSMVTVSTGAGWWAGCQGVFLGGDVVYPKSDCWFNVASVLFQYSILFKQEQGKQPACSSRFTQEEPRCPWLKIFPMLTRHAIPKQTHFAEKLPEASEDRYS